ncbi:hypothetical protein [Thiothrix subterranea]|uniref:Lipoprotein n=1 Tax=Thiothrix subterranea TaxID=2735563 RepID=A0ABU0Y382_9GAMM|nr:hypothetical protein [Thiothrix subterranea]MDQ5767234.1 hypothetical protein [Thiothrix subterranea]
MKRVIIFIGVLLLAGCATTDSYVKQDGAALTEQERAQVKVICGNYAESGAGINMAAIPHTMTATTTGTVSTFGNMANINGVTTYNTAPDSTALLGAGIAKAVARNERFNDCALALGLKKKESK